MGGACGRSTKQTIALDLAAVPPAARKVVVDGAATFGDVGPVQITLAPGADATRLAQATLDAATTKRTLPLSELYRRGPVRRFRAVGQGYDHGLARVARGYGVVIADWAEGEDRAALRAYRCPSCCITSTLFWAVWKHFLRSPDAMRWRTSSERECCRRIRWRPGP